jgi:AcrR family transcriptional regulator
VPSTPKRAAVQAGVLSVTERLLAEGASWADLGIERIATAAGISRTAFYFYFRDKRELLMRLTEDVAELLYLEADRWYSGDGDPEDEIREALAKIAALYAEHAALLRAIVEVSTYDEEVARFWRNLMGRFVEATRVRIEAERAAGRAAAHPAAATAFALVWMTERTFYQLMVQPPPFARDEAVDALVGVWTRGVYG